MLVQLWFLLLGGKLLKINDSLNATLSNCEPVQQTLGKYGPMIKNGCLFLSATSGNSSATSGNSSATASPEESVTAAGFSILIPVFSIPVVLFLLN